MASRGSGRRLSQVGQAWVGNKGKTVVRIGSLKARMLWVSSLTPYSSFYKDEDKCDSFLLSLKPFKQCSMLVYFTHLIIVFLFIFSLLYFFSSNFIKI